MIPWIARGRALIPACGAALASLVLLGPSRFGMGITSSEASWLHDAPGLAPRLLDAWAAIATSDGIFRAPAFLLVAIAVLALVLAGARILSPLAAGAAGLAVAAEAALLAGGPRVGSVVPLAAVEAAVCLAVIAASKPDRSDWSGAARSGAPALLGIAIAMGALEPGLGAFPLGAAAGALAHRSNRRRRSWLYWLILVVFSLALGRVLVDHSGLTWLEGAGRTARLIQKLVLLVGALVVVAAVDRPLGADSDDDRRQSLMNPALGGTMAALAWLSIPVLRDRTASPLPVLLMAIPLLGVLALASASRGERSPVSDAPVRPRPRPATVMALVLAVLVLAAFAKRRAYPDDVLPLVGALGEMRTAAPAVREILAGPGLTPGVVAHVGGRLGIDIVSSPRDAQTGILSIASVAPSTAERDALAARLGDRVLDRFGLAGEESILRWTTFRPLSLRIEAAGARPNIAIVSVDTLRADHLGAYGYARATSPLIDAWAKDALVYERAMSAAPATAPSFSSLMTGRLPIAHGVRKNYEFLDAGNWTLARILARAGYDTAGFVSSFVLSRENSGLDLGIAHYDQAFEGREQNREDRPLRLAPALAASVGSWLDAQRGAHRPWFLWVHAIDPHGPYTPLPEFRNVFEGGPSRTVARSLIPDYQWLGTNDFATYVNAYDDEILQTDRSIGALLAKIEALPSPQGTILVFVADHGEAFGEHGVYFQHGQSLHTEEIHVPLIVKDTARPRAGRVATPVSLLDLLPTLLERLSIVADLPFDGTTLDARERDPETTLLANWRPGDVMACRPPLKLIAHGRHAARHGESADAPLAGRDVLVYDIDADPAEAHPIAGPSAAREALAAVAGALLSRDPLDADSGRALERRQWETLSPEAQEKLRSLGYAGP